MVSLCSARTPDSLRKSFEPRSTYSGRTIQTDGIRQAKPITPSPVDLRFTWSEAMKIARPSRPEVPFKRKRSPPPQATKLLRYSFLAGLVFMVLLAIVFLPRMFPDQPPIEIVRSFHFETPNNQTRIYIDSVTVSLELAKFRANFTVAE